MILYFLPLKPCSGADLASKVAKNLLKSEKSHIFDEINHKTNHLIL